MPDKKHEGLRPETLAVAHGYDPEMGMWSAKPPIFMTSTFVYPSAQYAKDVHEAFFDNSGPLKGSTHHIYARLGHPGLDFLGDGRISFQELARIVFALANFFSVIAVPCAGFVNNIGLHSHIDDFTFT